MTASPTDQLVAEARYHRERYDLYRAKSYGPRPTRPGRLRELQRASELADSRLSRARDAALITTTRGDPAP